mmetsp:Transcript_14207/g.36257  ORF Transcript_14207/g.36257 Transcript_14207/m.36257 type:complete len:632 (+) Transcript_14207:45-1940(+)
MDDLIGALDDFAMPALDDFQQIIRPALEITSLPSGISPDVTNLLADADAADDDDAEDEFNEDEWEPMPDGIFAETPFLSLLETSTSSDSESPPASSVDASTAIENDDIAASEANEGVKAYDADDLFIHDIEIPWTDEVYVPPYVPTPRPPSSGPSDNGGPVTWRPTPATPPPEAAPIPPNALEAGNESLGPCPASPVQYEHHPASSQDGTLTRPHSPAFQNPAPHNNYLENMQDRQNSPISEQRASTYPESDPTGHDEVVAFEQSEYPDRPPSAADVEHLPLDPDRNSPERDEQSIYDSDARSVTDSSQDSHSTSTSQLDRISESTTDESNSDSASIDVPDGSYHAPDIGRHERLDALPVNAPQNPQAWPEQLDVFTFASDGKRTLSDAEQTQLAEDLPFKAPDILSPEDKFVAESIQFTFEHVGGNCGEGVTDRASTLSSAHLSGSFASPSSPTLSSSSSTDSCDSTNMIPKKNQEGGEEADIELGEEEAMPPLTPFELDEEVLPPPTPFESEEVEGLRPSAPVPLPGLTLPISNAPKLVEMHECGHGAHDEGAGEAEYHEEGEGAQANFENHMEESIGVQDMDFDVSSVNGCHPGQRRKQTQQQQAQQQQAQNTADCFALFFLLCSECQ